MSWGWIHVAFSLNAALLDACVLSVLKRGDTYGYELTQSIQRAFEVSESTLYPVLRRLQKDGFLSTYDQPYQGRNRRYYAITPLGRERHRVYLDEWVSFKDRVEELLSGGATV